MDFDNDKIPVEELVDEDYWMHSTLEECEEIETRLAELEREVEFFRQWSEYEDYFRDFF